MNQNRNTRNLKNGFYADPWSSITGRCQNVEKACAKIAEITSYNPTKNHTIESKRIKVPLEVIGRGQHRNNFYFIAGTRNGFHFVLFCCKNDSTLHLE